MKKKILLILLIMSSVIVSAQTPKAMKAKVMVVPEEAYCINAGFYKSNPDGTKIADYRQALLSDNILDVINTFENVMASYNFQLVNLQQILDDLKEENSLDNVLLSKDDAVIIEDDLDKMSRVAQSDIIVKIAPKVVPFGPEHRIELRVSAIDCASRKAIQAFGPITKTSSGSISMLLKAAVTDNIEVFAMGLSNHFNKMLNEGREGTIIIKIAESCPLNLESTVTYKGEQGELADLIEYWISENAINGKYTGGKSSRVSMKLDQVHIPLVGKGVFGKTKAFSMEDFVKSGLVNLLNEYGISVSVHPIGIGKAYLILGGK